MKVVALLAMRNEALYLARCLDHMREQDIECCIIDNGSTDNSVQIAERYLGDPVLRIDHYPYPGHYDWSGLLAFKQQLARDVQADWFIHHDADEIREAPQAGQTLREAIETVDREGYNAINFDEFVFLPAGDNEDHVGADYVRDMKHYFYFHPHNSHRVNAWKNLEGDVDIVSSGGHSITFDGQKTYPKNFILRHYICLSLRHANDKYCRDYVYSKKEVEERGWHRRRVAAQQSGVVLPEISRLKILGADGVFDRTAPYKANILFANE